MSKKHNTIAVIGLFISVLVFLFGNNVIGRWSEDKKIEKNEDSTISLDEIDNFTNTNNCKKLFSTTNNGNTLETPNLWINTMHKDERRFFISFKRQKRDSSKNVKISVTADFRDIKQEEGVLEKHKNRSSTLILYYENGASSSIALSNSIISSHEIGVLAIYESDYLDEETMFKLVNNNISNIFIVTSLGATVSEENQGFLEKKTNPKNFSQVKEHLGCILSF